MVQNKKDLFGAVFAEFLATALFVWIGCGAAVSSNKWGTNSDGTGGANMLGIATAFGLGISTLAYGIGHVSGGHINPAVTFSFLIRREMSIVSAILYMLAQFTGAVFGALFLWASTASLTSSCGTLEASSLVDSAVCQASCDPNDMTDCGAPFNLGANGLADNITVGCGFIAELIGTFLLVFTVLMSAVHPQNGSGPNAAPIAIGWSVFMAHLVLISLTGCGINPARTFGPAVVASFSGSSTWKRGSWVYYVAPFVGSMFATGAYELIFKKVPTVEETAGKEGFEDNDAPAESAVDAN